jgi:hypothetical protein
MPSGEEHPHSKLQTAPIKRGKDAFRGTQGRAPGRPRSPPKGGVSKTRVGEILGLEASSILDDLLSQGLIYCDPSRELNFWRPTPSALLALGLRSHTDIPALTGNKRDDKQRYYDVSNDPHYYRDRAWIHRSDLAVDSPGFGSR